MSEDWVTQSIQYHIYTMSGKNIPDIFDCNFKKDYQILIIFDISISYTTCNQMIVQFSTAPIICFCPTWVFKIIFCLFGFSRVVQKQTFGEVVTKMVI